MTLAGEYADPMLLRMTGLFEINFLHDIDVVAFWNCKKISLVGKPGASG